MGIRTIRKTCIHGELFESSYFGEMKNVKKE